MLGFATNITSILYTTIKFIIQKYKSKIQKVDIEPKNDDIREISIKDSSQTEMIFKENLLFRKLKRGHRTLDLENSFEDYGVEHRFELDLVLRPANPLENEIMFKTLDGDGCILSVDLATSVKDIKEKVNSLLKIGNDTRKFSYNEQELDDEKTLADYQIEYGQEILVDYTEHREQKQTSLKRYSSSSSSSDGE